MAFGSVNEGPAGFVVMPRNGGPIRPGQETGRGLHDGRLPGVVLRADGTPIHNLECRWRDARGGGEMLDRLREKNEEAFRRAQGQQRLSARIASYDWPFKMQQHAPGSRIPRSRPRRWRCTASGEAHEDFGRKCLLASGWWERDVRFVPGLLGRRPQRRTMGPHKRHR